MWLYCVWGDLHQEFGFSRPKGPNLCSIKANYTDAVFVYAVRFFHSITPILCGNKKDKDCLVHIIRPPLPPLPPFLPLYLSWVFYISTNIHPETILHIPQFGFRRVYSTFQPWGCLIFWLIFAKTSELSEVCCHFQWPPVKLRAQTTVQCQPVASSHHQQGEPRQRAIFRCLRVCPCARYYPSLQSGVAAARLRSHSIRAARTSHNNESQVYKTQRSLAAQRRGD